MRHKAVFYHAGCPVCADAQRQLLGALDAERYAVEIVHLGEQPWRIAEAAAAGVVSVPALLLDATPLHINFGAALTDLG